MNKIDPIKLGIIWKRLNGMIDEVAESFIRSSFSAVVRENYDMAFSLLDVHGRQFIQTKKVFLPLSEHCHTQSKKY